MTAVVATLALVIWLLLGEPLLGRWSHRRMLAQLDGGNTESRRRFFRSWTWQAWLLAVITLAVAGINGWTPVSLGLQLPHAMGSLSAGLLVGMLIALAGGALVGLLLGLRLKNKPRTQVVAGGDQVLHMLPRGQAERRGFALLALTAAVTEELIWRGFGVAVLRDVWPSLPILPVIVVLGAAFGWAHFYQGPGGMLATALIGGLMAWLYLSTGSLLLPMLLHVLVDLRALLLPVPPEAVIDATRDAGDRPASPDIRNDRTRSSITEEHP